MSWSRCPTLPASSSHIACRTPRSTTLYMLWKLLNAAQCIVIGPVCGFVTVFVCLRVCYNDNTKLRASTGFVRTGSDHLQLIKFWPSCVPGGRGSAAGRKFLAPPYYSQRAVFASLWGPFSFLLCSCIGEQFCGRALRRCSAVRQSSERDDPRWTWSHQRHRGHAAHVESHLPRCRGCSAL